MSLDELLRTVSSGGAIPNDDAGITYFCALGCRPSFLTDNPDVMRWHRQVAHNVSDSRKEPERQ